jgi:spermidine/putrescine transport system substrate-binding protein
MTTLHRLAAPAALLALGAGAAAAQDDELLVFDYSGFEDPAYHQAYVEMHGESPTFAFFGDEDEAFQKLRSGFAADVTHICAGSVSKWRASGIIEPWEISRLDHFDDLNTDLTGEDVTAGSEDFYFLPTDFGSTAIAYNADEVPAEDVASLDVFHDADYAGRMTLPDNVDDAFALAYLATGVTNWADVTDAEFEAAADWLRAAHDNLRTYWTDPAELSQLLASGEVLVSWAWNETLPTMADMGFPIGFQREAEEGSSLWVCGYVNMADAPGSEDKAYDYANAILGPAATEPLLAAGFGQANQTALQALGEEALEASGLGAIDAPVLAQLPISPEQRARHNEAFERIKAGF